MSNLERASLTSSSDTIAAGGNTTEQAKPDQRVEVVSVKFTEAPAEAQSFIQPAISATSINVTDDEERGPRCNMELNAMSIGGPIVIGVLVLIVVILFASATTIDAGHVGVVKRFGAVSDEPLEEGLHFVTPFVNTVAEVDTRIGTVAHQVSSSSKDLQSIHTEVSVQFYILGANAPGLLQKVGNRDAIENSIISPAIQESGKAVTAKYTAEHLVTKRELVKGQIRSQLEEFIKTTLASKGITGGIAIANVAITDFEFSPEFNKAIELKVRAEQLALQAKNEKIRRVTQAEAAAQEQKIAAEAEAYKIKKQSEARAAAIKIEAASLKSNPELIQLRLAEKWDGVLPQFSGAGGNMLFDMKSIMEKKKTHPRARRIS